MKLQKLLERKSKGFAKKTDDVQKTDDSAQELMPAGTDPFAFDAGSDGATKSQPEPNVKDEFSSDVSSLPPEPATDPTADGALDDDSTKTAPVKDGKDSSKIEIPKQVKKALNAMSDIKSNEDSEQKDLAGDCYDHLQHLIDMEDHEGMIAFADIALHLVDADLSDSTKSKVPPQFAGK